MKRPNVLFILADDLGWCDLGVEGSAYYESAHIDRIANEGMRFTQGYAACQVCSPSRASILTGKYPTRHGITDWIGSRSGEQWREAGRETPLLPPHYRRGLDAAEITFAEVMRREGYRTFFAGKWHLGDDEICPENFGFEINKGGWKAGSPMGGYFSPWENPMLEPGEPGESLPLRLARDTRAFIEAHTDEPFLAYLSFYSVHAPIQTTQEKWERFRRKAAAQGAVDRRFIFDRRLPVRQVQDCPVYAGMIEAMDEAVGIVLAALDEQGLADDTIVVFTSDNGGVSSGDAYSSSMLPLRGGKGRQWEGGIREPFHFRYPRRIAAGSTCDVPASGIDFYPTLLELVGIPAPSEQVVDGLSLVRLLEGNADSDVVTRDLFWHYPHYGNQGGEPSSMIRSGSWKLIHYYEDGRDELYDLAGDPGERDDLAAAERGRAAELRRRLDRWLTDLDARRPAADPRYEAEKEKARLKHLEQELMPALERDHAQYLDPDWQPNDDWWGSQLVVD